MVCAYSPKHSGRPLASARAPPERIGDEAVQALAFGELCFEVLPLAVQIVQAIVGLAQERIDAFVIIEPSAQYMGELSKKRYEKFSNLGSLRNPCVFSARQFVLKKINYAV